MCRNRSHLHTVHMMCLCVASLWCEQVLSKGCVCLFSRCGLVVMWTSSAAGRNLDWKTSSCMSSWHTLSFVTVYLVSAVFCQIFIKFQHCLQCLTLFVRRQEEHPACKNQVMRCWCCYLSGSEVSIRSSQCHCHPNTPSTLASLKSRLVFAARCYASAVLAMGLCLSVTSRSSTKMAEHRITQATPHNSPGTLVFWRQRSPRNSTGVTPYWGPKCTKSVTFDK